MCEWETIVSAVDRTAPLLRGCMADAAPLSVTRDRVTIGFDPEFADALKRVKVARNREVVQTIVGQVLRRPVSVHFELLPETGEVRVPADREVASDPNARAADEAAPADKAAPADGERGGKKAGKSRKKSAREWMEDAHVRDVIDMFGGQVIDIREP